MSDSLLYNFKSCRTDDAGYLLVMLLTQLLV